MTKNSRQSSKTSVTNWTIIPLLFPDHREHRKPEKCLEILWSATSRRPEKEKLKGKYSELIDGVWKSIELRYNQESIQTLKKIEDVVLSIANSEGDMGLKSLPEILPDCIDSSGLAQELSEMKTYVKIYNSKTGSNLSKIRKLKDLCHVMNSSDFMKISAPNLHIFLKWYGTFSVSSATAERNFSQMRHL